MFSRERWFSDIGGKLMSVAYVAFIIEIILACIGAAVLVVYGLREAFMWTNPMGLLCIPAAAVAVLLAPFLAWAASAALYAFGQFVENSDILVANGIVYQKEELVTLKEIFDACQNERKGTMEIKYRKK
ncbi:MAG: hypothetical protein IJN42_06565 [Clostridia bacterium]|nr:hypothetical protein [Clostridia bacterium]